MSFFDKIIDKAQGKKDAPAKPEDAGKSSSSFSKKKKAGVWANKERTRKALKSALRRKLPEEERFAKVKSAMEGDKVEEIIRESNREVYESALASNKQRGPKTDKAIQLYVSSDEANKAEVDARNEEIRLKNRTPEDYKKEIKAGRRMALQEKIKTALPLHGEDQYSESERFLMKLEKDRKAGKKRSADQKKQDAEALRKILIKEGLRSERASESDWKGAEEVLTTDLEGAEQADLAAAREKEAKDAKAKAARERREKIEKEAYEPDGLFDEMQNPEAVDRLEKAKLRERVQSGLKKKYRKPKVDKRLMGGPKPKDQSQREKDEDARMKREARH